MATQTYNQWPDPEIKHEGVHVKLEHRPRKKHKWHLREGSILYYVRNILMAAFSIMLAWCWYVLIWAMSGQ